MSKTEILYQDATNTLTFENEYGESVEVGLLSVFRVEMIPRIHTGENEELNDLYFFNATGNMICVLNRVTEQYAREVAEEIKQKREALTNG